MKLPAVSCEDCTHCAFQFSEAEKVGIEERLDGTMHLMVKGINIKYKEITSRPVRESEKIQNILTKTTKLSPDHPWKKYDFKYGKKAKELKSSIP